jgi:translocation and assembly module TamB
MRRGYRIALWVAGVLLGLPLCLSLALYLAGNSASGRAWLEQATARWSSGRVSVSGLAGPLPGQLQLKRLEVRDDTGLWLTADEVQLRWSPWQLLRRNLRGRSLKAAHVEISRAPTYARSGKSGSSGLPGGLHVELDELVIDRLDLGAALAGNAVGLQISGHGSWASLNRASLQLLARRLDAEPATYSASAQFERAKVQAQVDIEEAADGPLGHLAQLPGLGALSIHLKMAGPRAAVDATLAAQAGALHASGHGHVNLRTRAASIALSLDSGAMAPRSGVSWQRLHLEGHWDGPISAPDTSVQLSADALELPWLQLRTLAAQMRGQQGALQLDANVGGLVLPGEFASIVAGSPIVVKAQMRLDQTGHPIEFSLSHTLVSATGRWSGEFTDGRGTLAANITDLKPVAALAALDLNGHGSLDAQVRTSADDTRIELASTLAISGGAWPLGALLKPTTKVTAAMIVDRHGIDIERSQLESGPTQAALHGAGRNGVLDLHWTVNAQNLSLLSPRISGNASGSGQLKGQVPRLTLAADMSGNLAANGGPSGSLKLNLRAHDLPQRASYELQCDGILDAAPLAIAASLERAENGAIDAKLERAQWRSADAAGALHIPADASAPSGHLSAHMAQVADLDHLLAQQLKGSINASLELDGGAPGGRALIKVDAKDLGVPAQQLQSLEISGSIAAPSTHPVLALKANAQALIGALPAQVQAQLDGPPDALNLKLNASTPSAEATPSTLSLAARLDQERLEVQLNALEAQYQGQTLKLSAPAVLSFAQGINVPQLHLALAAGGHIDLAAQVHGSGSDAAGSLSFNASGLRAANGPARSLPAMDIKANAQLQGTLAQLQLQADSGARLHFQASGQAPLNATTPMALKLDGDIDLELANPMLEISGQRLLGKAHLAATLAGTLAAPKAQGTLMLTHADLQDYPRGLHLSDISASIAADGAQVRLQQLSAHAGTGTVSATGTLGLGAGLPLDLKFQASAAQVLTSDLITANMDAKLSLTGPLRHALNIGGSLHVIRADINIPEAFPPSVAVLDVRRAGRQITPPEDTTLERINLDVAVDAPRAVFVRGRGLDAEVGGNLHVGGTIAAPDISGGFDLRNGTVAVAGASLTFTSGKLSFNGSGVKKTMDPTLDFTASKTINGINANLNVGGFADAPVITLSSTPEQSPDQILALILFGVQPAQLSTLQIAQIAAALASMTAGIGNGFSPLSAVQRKLRLDRLAISGSSNSTTPTPGSTAPSNNTAASIEAGRYVSRRVYVGAKQSTTGSSQAQVQIDLTQHLKVETVLGTGGGTLQGATPQNDPGSSVGLSYQLEY